MIIYIYALIYSGLGVFFYVCAPTGRFFCVFLVDISFYLKKDFGIFLFDSCIYNLKEEMG